MTIRKLALLLCPVFLPTISAAQNALPVPVVAGLDSLRAGHCDGAFRIWTTAFTSDDDAAKRTALIGSCELLTRFGALRGYDVVRQVRVGPNLVRLYVVLRYDTQPIYLLLVAYRPDTAWKITSVNWNSRAERVFPPSVLPAEELEP